MVLKSSTTSSYFEGQNEFSCDLKNIVGYTHKRKHAFLFCGKTLI